MINLQLPLSALALRLGSEFLAKCAEHADAIRDELRATTIGELKYKVSLDTSGAEAQLAALEVATPAVDVYQNAADALGLSRQDAKAQVLGAQYVAPDESDDAETVLDMRGTIGSPEMTAALEADQAKLEALGAFDDPQPSAAGATTPTPAAPSAARELRYNEAAAGYPLEAMRAANWSDDQLVAAGYATWEEAPAPFVAAPPAPPAPPAPATAPSGNDSSGPTSLDSAGLPWDERIHSSSRNTVADGTWRRKRGVDESLVQQVEAELRGAPKLPTPGPMAPSAPIAPVSAPAPQDANSPTDFASLTRWLLPLTTGGKISPTDVQLIIADVGADRAIAHLPGLSAHPDLIPAVVARVKAKAGL